MTDNPLSRISERYKLGRVIKANASSTVYVAAEAGRQAEVVVKIIGVDAGTTTDAARSRFQQAVSTIGNLRLTGFPAVLESGWTSPAEGYLVMEPAVFRPAVEITGAAAARIVGWIARAARALDALHLAGTAHLNVRPDNLGVTGAPDDENVVLFGLGTGWLHRPAIGDVFAAPELGHGDATPELWRCDLYSLARTACALLGLKAVSEGADGVAVGLPDAIRKNLADPQALRTVLERSLDREPARRPSSLSELARDFDRSLGSPASGGPRGPGQTQPIEIEPLAEPVAGGQRDASGPDAGEDRTVRLDPAAIARMRTEAEAPAAADAAGARGPAAAGRETVHSTAEVRLSATGSEAAAASPGSPPGGAATAAAGPVTPGAATIHDDLLDLEETPPAPIPLPPLPDSEPEIDVVPETAPAAPAPPARVQAQRRGLQRLLGLPWVWVAAAGALVVLVFAASLALVAAHRRSARAAEAAATPSPTAAPTAAPAVPERTLADELEALVAAGEIGQAEQRLSAESDADIARLPLYEQQRLATVRQTIADRHRWDLVRELDRSLARGDLDGLERAVEALGDAPPGGQSPSGGPISSVELERKLSAARGLVELNRRVRTARERYQWAEVLENAKPILASWPNCAAVLRARDEAATALEEEADALEVKGRLGEAREKLAAVERSWPEREGLQQRVAALDSRLAAERSTRAALDGATEAGKQGRPDTGLEMLAGLDAQGPLRAEIEATRQRLSTQLATLDAGTPRLTIAAGSTLEFDKNQPAIVTLDVQDDFAVKMVGFFARRKGGETFVQFAAVMQNPGRYSVSIPLAFHQNDTVQFYAIARDASGHTGELGSSAAPLEIKRHRRGWFGR